MRAIKYIGFGILFEIFVISSYLTSEEIKIWVYGETIESEIVYLSKLEDDKYKLVFKLNENATERSLIISKKAYNIIKEDQVFRVK